MVIQLITKGLRLATSLIRHQHVDNHFCTYLALILDMRIQVFLPYMMRLACKLTANSTFRKWMYELFEPTSETFNTGILIKWTAKKISHTSKKSAII